MILFHPACPIGTVAVESVRVLGVVSTRGKSVIATRLDIFTATEIPPHPANYWAFELGTYGGGTIFEVRFAYAEPYKGLAAGRNAVLLAKPVVYGVGEVVALRVKPVGSPSSLTGCDVAVGIEEP